MKEPTISLQSYIDTKCEGLQEQIDRRMHTADDLRNLNVQNTNTRFEAIDRATDLATQAIDKRLDHMNDMRHQLDAQGSTFITHVEHSALERRMQIVEQQGANVQGRIWAITIGLTIMSMAVSFGIHFIH